MNKENPMRALLIDKVVVNIGVGEAGEKLMKAEKVLQMITGRKPVRTISKTTNRDLGIRKGMPIGCKVTLRGEEAEKFLKTALWVRANRLADYTFDNQGNLSFGIPDYTELPDMKYDPEIGIFGMDVCVTMKRKGYRVSKRRRARAKIPSRARISPKETMEFFKKNFNIEVI